MKKKKKKMQSIMVAVTIANKSEFEHFIPLKVEKHIYYLYIVFRNF